MIRRSLLGLAALLLAWPLSGASKPSFDDLVANLKSPNAKTRQEAAAALAKSRRREAVTPLAALVRDPEFKVRLEVVRALRDLRDASGVPALVTLLGDGEAEIRQEAIATIVEIYSEKERSGPVGRFLQIFSDEADRTSIAPHVKVEPSVYEGLAKCLRDENGDVRESAALALGILGASGKTRELVATFQDPVPGVRAAAATALGKVGAQEDGRALIPLLADESLEVKNRALQALGVLRVTEAGPALRELYEQNRRREWGLRVLATLSRIADPAQSELFLQLIQDPDPERKRLAVEGLGRISDSSRLPAFKKDYQRERNEEVKLAYSFAITRMGDRAFLDSLVLSLPSRTMGTRSRDYILEMGRPILPDLYPYLNDPDAEVRSALCEIIGSLGDAEAIPRLQPLLGDPSASVADRANRAVERLRRGSSSGQ
jgi:HEAT repeat protein